MSYPLDSDEHPSATPQEQPSTPSAPPSSDSWFDETVFQDDPFFQQRDLFGSLLPTSLSFQHSGQVFPSLLSPLGPWPSSLSGTVIPTFFPLNRLRPLTLRRQHRQRSDDAVEDEEDEEEEEERGSSTDLMQHGQYCYQSLGHFVNGVGEKKIRESYGDGRTKETVSRHIGDGVSAEVHRVREGSTERIEKNVVGVPDFDRFDELWNERKALVGRKRSRDRDGEDRQLHAPPRKRRKKTKRLMLMDEDTLASAVASGVDQAMAQWKKKMEDEE